MSCQEVFLAMPNPRPPPPIKAIRPIIISFVRFESFKNPTTNVKNKIIKANTIKDNTMISLVFLCS